MNKFNLKEVFVIGFALFAMFFGAGNLIFPPLLGYTSGSNWIISSLGFIITGVGMTFLGLQATTLAGGEINDVTHKLGPTVGTMTSFLVILCIGPLLAIPRTAATTHEIAFLGVDFPAAITSFIFFALTLFFVLKPSKMIDYIGGFLTPALLIILALMIAKGIISPLGSIPIVMESPGHSFSNGFQEGYQTMDTLASMVFTGIVVSSIVNKGHAKEEVPKIALYAGIIAIACLAIVYTGLAYLGASYPGGHPEIERVELLANITHGLFGKMGHLILALAISLACLTTSIGLTSSCAEYFSDLCSNKISYRNFAIGITVFSGLFSILGVDAIVRFAVPILGVLYPCIIVLLIMVLFDQYINSNWVYYLGVLGAFIVSFSEVMGGAFNIEFLQNLPKSLPLVSLGFAWILPAIIGAVLGALLGPKNIIK